MHYILYITDYIRYIIYNLFYTFYHIILYVRSCPRGASNTDPQTCVDTAVVGAACARHVSGDALAQIGVVGRHCSRGVFKNPRVSAPQKNPNPLASWTGYGAPGAAGGKELRVSAGISVHVRAWRIRSVTTTAGFDWRPCAGTLPVQHRMAPSLPTRAHNEFPPHARSC